MIHFYITSLYWEDYYTFADPHQDHHLYPAVPTAERIALLYLIYIGREHKKPHRNPHRQLFGIGNL